MTNLTFCDKLHYPHTVFWDIAVKIMYNNWNTTEKNNYEITYIIEKFKN